MVEFAVNLANNMEFSDIGKFVLNDDWAFEQKLDGERLALVVRDGRVSGLNRRGVNTPVHREIIKTFVGTTGTWIFDGEWVDDVFWIFDMPMAPQGIEPRTPYSLRRHPMEAIVPHIAALTRRVQLVPSYTTPESKVAIARAVVENHAEGLMLKRRSAPYIIGKRTDNMLKAKLIKTVDCIVTEVGREGKHSIAVSLYENGVLLPDHGVGSVKVTDEMLHALEVGEVVEVIYLYCTDDRRLYQPRFGRRRPDKNPTDCTTDQLQYTDKTVLAPL